MNHDAFEEWLDSEEFYEYCQTYRHAPDVLKVMDMPNAAEAFSQLQNAILTKLREAA